MCNVAGSRDVTAGGSRLYNYLSILLCVRVARRLHAREINSCGRDERTLHANSWLKKLKARKTTDDRVHGDVCHDGIRFETATVTVSNILTQRWPTCRIDLAKLRPKLFGVILSIIDHHPYLFVTIFCIPTADSSTGRFMHRHGFQRLLSMFDILVVD